MDWFDGVKYRGARHTPEECENPPNGVTPKGVLCKCPDYNKCNCPYPNCKCATTSDQCNQFHDHNKKRCIWDKNTKICGSLSKS